MLIIFHNEREFLPKIKSFLSHRHRPPQCDQIGLFFKVVGNKFCYQSSPNIWKQFGQFCSISHFQKKMLWLLFGQYWQIRVTFNSDLWSHWSPSSNDDDDDIEKRNAARRRMRAKPGSSRTIGKTFPTHFYDVINVFTQKMLFPFDVVLTYLTV